MSDISLNIATIRRGRHDACNISRFLAISNFSHDKYRKNGLFMAYQQGMPCSFLVGMPFSSVAVYGVNWVLHAPPTGFICVVHSS